MSPRVLLLLALAGAAPAATLAAPAAPASAPPGMLTVTMDQAKVARLPAGTSTVVIGNPTFADVTMLKDKSAIVITGKAFGETNFIALDNTGEILDEKEIRVIPTRGVLVLQKGDSRVSYYCNPTCMPTFQLGDDNDYYTKTGAQITLHDGQAQGSNSASLSGSSK
jgi:hypothetical protein